MIDALYQDGLRCFRIDCAQMNQKEYTEVIKNIDEAFRKRDDTPSVLLDLKGPMPFITKIGKDKQTEITVKKGQKIRILHDYLCRNIEEEENSESYLYIDKRISKGVGINDILVINYSDVRLKVTGIEKIKPHPLLISKNLPKIKENIFHSNSSPYLYHPNININDNFNLREKKSGVKIEYDNYFNNVEEDSNEENSTLGCITSVNENQTNLYKNMEDEELLIDATNFDNYYEEKLKNKHQKMTQVYNNFIKKHSQMSNQHITQFYDKDRDKSNYDIDKLSAISGVNYSILSELGIGGMVVGEHLSTTLSRKQRLRKGSCFSQNNQRDNNHMNMMILCEVIEEGLIQKNRTISLQGKDIIKECDIPMMNAKDIIDLNKAVSLNIGTVSIFVNSSENLEEVKEILGEEARKNIKLYAKIETQNAIMNFDSILQKADGIIIHHGLVTSSFSFEELSLVEIYMVEKCKLQNKPIILQNYSLKSLNINKPVISKISTLDFAVKEGIDSIILEEEINSEKCFLAAIAACRDVLLQIEAFEDSRNKYEEMSKFLSLNEIKNQLCLNLFDCAAKLSYEIKNDLIILFSDNSKLAKALSNYRPNCLIVYPTNDLLEVKYIRTFRGVVPFYYDKDIYDENIKFEELIKFLLISLKNKNVIGNDIEKIVIVNAFIDSNLRYKNSFFIIYPEML